MWQQRIWNFGSRQTTFINPFPRIFRRSFDQQLGAGEIVRRCIERAKIGHRKNIDLSGKLPEVTHHLMGDKQRQRM
jgi:hypothetical protein